MSGPKYPDVCVQLTGCDGNAYAVLGACQRAARRAGVSAREVLDFTVEATSDDYDHLLATAMRWFDVS